MNVKLLRQVKDQILKEPMQFAMKDFYNDTTDCGHTPPNCGTAACIAGWTIAISREKTPYEVSEMCLNNASLAAHLLGLDHEKSFDLFIVRYWPQKFRIKYQNSKTERQQAKIAADRIEHFIKTGGKE